MGCGDIDFGGFGAARFGAAAHETIFDALEAICHQAVISHQAPSAKRQAPVSKPFSLHAHRNFHPAPARQAPSAEHLFPNLFHSTPIYPPAGAVFF